MEGSQHTPTLNQHLDRFVNQMQSEIGRTGKTLHQISSEYLALKADHLELAQKVEALDIPDAVDLTPELFREQCDLLQRLYLLKDRVGVGLESIQDHPWQPFAHPDHRPEEFEHLSRTIRFVSIQLGKFWVEVQSFPLFLNNLDQLSVHELDQIFLWVQGSKPWNELILQSRVVPALTQASSRKAIFEFMRNVKSIRALCEKAKKFQNPSALTTVQFQSSPAALNEGAELVRQFQLAQCNRVELEARISHAQKQLEQVRLIQKFFSSLGLSTGAPQATRPQEALLVFKSKELISKIPKKIMNWRQPPILANNQNVRILGLQDRAKPILEARKRIDAHFKMGSAMDPEALRTLAGVLTSGGVFRTFRTPYQDALNQYKALLRDEITAKSKAKETPLQMADRLNEWANFIEQSQSFERNSDIAKTFGSFFKGIDTDFATALEANLWANQVRTDLTVSESSFSELLIQFVFKSDEEKLNEIVESLKSEEAQSLHGILERAEISDETTFTELGSQVHAQLAGYERLLHILTTLEVYPQVSLTALGELRQIHEEVAFLTAQLDHDAEPKNILKGYYFGPDTDLGLIENAIAYLDFIDRSTISEGLKTSLLSVHGPQRFGETRALVTQIQGTLAALMDLFQRLEVASRGQAQGVSHFPITKLLHQCHVAMKQSNLLEEWIELLKCERESRIRGVGMVLEFYEKNTVHGSDSVLAYQLAFYASILKKVIAKSMSQAENSSSPLLVH